VSSIEPAVRMPPKWEPLLDRGATVDRIALAVDGLVAGRGSVLLAEGEAGIGKSALLGSRA
jgi:predicted ATPase